MDDLSDGWWREALTGFGRNLGFESFADSNSKVHNFTVGDNKYLLDVECSTDCVILAVFREIPADRVKAALRLLMRRCNFDSYLPFFVQIGLKDSNVAVLAARLERSQADSMFHAFEVICDLYAEAGL